MNEPDDLDGLLGTTIVTIGRQAELPAVQDLQLAVIGSGMFARHLIDGSRSLVIGRSHQCDIVIDDESISRRHAILTLGDTITVEDLGSANGTRVRGVRLGAESPSAITVGESVVVGSITLILQPRTLRIVRWSPSAFDARVDQACTSKAACAVLHLAVDRTDIEDALDGVLREADIASASGGTYRVLLLDTSPEGAEVAARRIERQLLGAGISCRTSVACCPRDGTTGGALRTRLAARKEPSKTLAPTDTMVVSTAEMQRLHRLVEQVADSRIGILLLGETGVGKEVFARAIHRASARANAPFVEINCAALTESLLESELFGHEKGSFTSAISTKQGLIETAEGGTLLLDEVGEMPLTTQAKLLRVLEAMQLRRVGGLKSRAIDVRFIAATNVDLERQVALGAFRRDLFYRLNGVTIAIPPLRERLDELEPLAHAFLRTASLGRRVPTLEPETLTRLKQYPWPGNVRELKHMIERAVLVCGDGSIRPEHLALREEAAVLRTPDRWSRSGDQTFHPPFRKGSEEEQRWILEALQTAGGNQTVAARLLGMSRRTLVSRLDEYNVERPRKDRKGPTK